MPSPPQIYMKKYTVLSKAFCPNDDGDCPAVVVNGDEVLIVGIPLTADEVTGMVAGTSNPRVGIGSGEIAIKIPLGVFQAAVDKVCATA
jgi:hypothetical protein